MSHSLKASWPVRGVPYPDLFEICPETTEGKARLRRDGDPLVAKTLIAPVVLELGRDTTFCRSAMMCSRSPYRKPFEEGCKQIKWALVGLPLHQLPLFQNRIRHMATAL